MKIDKVDKAFKIGGLNAELERYHSAATTAEEKRDAKVFIDYYLSSRTPFSKELNAFAKLFKKDRAKAKEQVDEALRFLKSVYGK